jgi:hypothetical protein
MNEQVPPAGGRMLGTGTCVALIAIGAGRRWVAGAGTRR